MFDLEDVRIIFIHSNETVTMVTKEKKFRASFTRKLPNLLSSSRSRGVGFKHDLHCVATVNEALNDEARCKVFTNQFL